MQEIHVSPGKFRGTVKGCDCALLDGNSTDGRAGVVLDATAECNNSESEVRTWELCGT